MNKAFSLALAIAAGALGMSCGGGDDDVGLGTSADDGGVEAHAGGSAGAGKGGAAGSAGMSGTGGSKAGSGGTAQDAGQDAQAGSGGTAGSGGLAGSAGAAGASGGAAGDAGASGSGGSAGLGGAAGSGGLSGAGGEGGAAGTGGNAGIGGAAGTAGTAGTGGAAGSAGSAGTGGAAGAAGQAGSAGTAGSAGACGGVPDACPGLPIALVGSGANPRLGTVKGDTTALCADYAGTCGFTSASKDAVYSITADVTGTLTVDTAGSVAVLNGFDPVIYLRSSCADAASELGCNDLVPPQIDTLTRGISAGQTVYLFVDAFDGSAGVYQVNVKLVPSVCGNGAVEPPEECDDSNTADGDGCSSVCKLDFSVVADKCPGGVLTLSGTGAQRTGTVSGDTKWFTNDTDGSCGGVYSGEGVFSFTPDISGTALVDLGGATQTPYDAVLYARSACDDDTKQVDCDETTALGGEKLEFPVTAGNAYYVFVDGIQGATGAFVAHVTVNQAQCGNGKKEGGEECDDGATLPGDGCSAACLLEPPGPIDVCPGADIALLQSGSQWVGTATGTTVNLTADYAGSCASSTGTSRDAVYRIVPSVSGKATIQVASANFDAVLYVRSSSCTGTEVECDDAIGDGGDELTFDASAGTPYWVFVDGWSGESGTFTLQVAVTPAACGNGLLEAGEACDDGDKASGDGCDAQCHFEGSCGALVEAEPNPYSAPQGIPPACGTFLLTGSMPSGDADYYQLDLVAGTTLQASTYYGAPGQCISGNDTVLSLWNTPMASGTNESGACTVSGYLACNDQASGNTPCSAITHAVVVTRPYVLKVHNYYTTKPMTSYGLQVTIK